MKAVLVIGGSDSSGGAGIQADIKTLATLGVYGMTAVTSVTSQGRNGLLDRHDVPCQSIAAQIEAAVCSGEIGAAKIGMLGTTSAAEAVFDTLRDHAIPNIVLDPVLAAEAGGSLADETLPDFLLASLGQVALVKPNMIEAARLTGKPIENIADMEAAAAALMRRGVGSVLVTGGHLGQDEMNDIFVDKTGMRRFAGPKLEPGAHGTGCTLSTAIAAYLALGFCLAEAVEKGRRFVRAAINGAVVLQGGWTVANQAAGRRALKQA